MYENDYSWIPSFFGGLFALAALGGLVISLIGPDTIRSRVFRAWLSVPVLLSMGSGAAAAIFGENLVLCSLVLFVLIFAVITSPPWIIAAYSVYAFARVIQSKAGGGGTTE